jgi:mono/diheme cytochrome c family protein
MHRFLISVATISLIASAGAAFAAEDVDAGKQLYTDNCALCHGDKAQGMKLKGQPVDGKKLAGDAAYWEFPVFKKAVVEGVDDQGRTMKVMPVFGKTGFIKPKAQMPTDADLQNVQAYLKTLGPAE